MAAAAEDREAVAAAAEEVAGHWMAVGVVAEEAEEAALMTMEEVAVAVLVRMVGAAEVALHPPPVDPAVPGRRPAAKARCPDPNPKS